MAFVACGLNYKTAPLAVREKMALSTEMHTTFLADLITCPSINEAAVLSTCNRTELYCDTDEPSQVAHWFTQQYPYTTHSLLPYLYQHEEEQGIRHLLRVASGLDSMMLGEPQILGQMKQAYQQACAAGTVKNNLRYAFQYVFSASKRIRSLSGIGNNPVSVAFAAVSLINQLFTDFTALRVLIIGSGETAGLVMKYLHQQGVTHFMVASRAQDNALQLSKIYQGVALSITDIPHYLAQADVVISATACPLPFISKKLVEHAQDTRQAKPMFFLDLAVPRDIEPEVADLPHVHLYNIDDLHTIIEKGMDERRTAALQAEQIVESELDNYLRKHRSLQATGVIRNYRTSMQHLAQHELQRALQRLSSGECQQQVLTEFSQRLVKKLTHQPTVGLRQAAWDGRAEVLDLANYLFTKA